MAALRLVPPLVDAATPRASARREALRLRGDGSTAAGADEVVREALLVIRVRDGGDFSLMHTPGQEEELALGFLLAEGWIEGPDDVAELEVCEGRDTVKVRLAHPPAVPASQRSLILHPSCGLCGRDDAVPFLASLAPVPAGSPFPLASLRGLGDRLREYQPLFAATGGSHASALFDATGALLAVAEDIGRHAAFDKMVGQAMKRGLDTTGHGALLSGRASLEMVAKAARARLALLVAVGAPSAAAIDLATRIGLALCGFARGDELTVYSGRDRLGD
jgi:FdhD protein